jgi:hypothetical protein
MPNPLRIARRVLGPVTEAQAYTAYRDHLSTCSGCGTSRPAEGGMGGNRCERGIALWTAWVAANERESAEAAAAAYQRRKR